jgi:hypothetical protein
MHKLLSRTFAVLALVAVVPAVAFASSGRIAGLGVSGDYVKDYTGTRTYLSGVTSVGNLVWVNPSDNAGMGAVLQNLFDGRFGTFAVNLNESAMPLFNGDWNSSGQSLDLTWGRKMGSGSLGVRFTRSYTADDGAGTKGDGATARNINGLGVGYGFSMNANTDVELSALYESRTFDDGAGTTEEGGASYVISGRAMVKAGSNLTVMPVVKILSSDASENSGTVQTDKNTGWSAGLAGNWALGSNDLFILGAEFNSLSNDDGTVKAKASEMPSVFMALESSVNNWLTLRFGAGNTVMDSHDDGTSVSHEHHWNSTMGAGVKAGSFMFDGTVGSTFYDGAVNSVMNGTPFGNVSVTYSF